MVALDHVCFEPPFRFSRATMRRYTAEAGAFTIVAETLAGELAGFIVGQSTLIRKEIQTYVVTLDVAVVERRKGVAGALMRALETRAVAEGAARVTLHVWTANEAAVRFYEGAGYRRVVLHQDFYGGGFDAWGYLKQVGKS